MGIRHVSPARARYSLEFSSAVAADIDTPISVIVPTYNCGTMIERCLAPLLEMQRRGEICEIIVVDDGSTDNTGEVAAAAGARVIPCKGPHGPAAARNVGAHEANGDLLWFVDADVVPKIDAARRVRQALANREYAAVFGSYDDTPPARNFLSQYKNLVHHHYHQQIRSSVSTFWAGCGAVWKETFLALGGFDVSYNRPSVEDIEFGYRLRAAGGLIRQAPELQGSHLKLWTFQKADCD